MPRRSSPELNEALGRAEPLLEKQSAAERVDLALDAWETCSALQPEFFDMFCIYFACKANLKRQDVRLGAKDRNALKDAVAEASRLGALRESVLRTAQAPGACSHVVGRLSDFPCFRITFVFVFVEAELAKMEVMCTAGHHLRSNLKQELRN